LYIYTNTELVSCVDDVLYGVLRCLLRLISLGVLKRTQST